MVFSQWFCFALPCDEYSSWNKRVQESGVWVLNSFTTTRGQSLYRQYVEKVLKKNPFKMFRIKAYSKFPVTWKGSEGHLSNFINVSMQKWISSSHWNESKWTFSLKCHAYCKATDLHWFTGSYTEWTHWVLHFSGIVWRLEWYFCNVPGQHISLMFKGQAFQQIGLLDPWRWDW